MPRSTPLAIALCAAALLAGCGSSGSKTKKNGSASSGAGASSSAPAAGAPTGGGKSGGTRVSMLNTAFRPARLKVKVGQTVTWVNQDPVDHNVTADSGASFKSSNFGQGRTFRFRPTKPGTIAYECTLHPGMKATLTVVK